MFYRYSLLLLTILLPLVTSASIFCEEIWSDWTDAGDVQPGGPDHKLICGMCATQNQTRQCLSLSSGCMCMGPSTQLIHVGDALCFFPDTPCCAPYVIQMNATQGVYTCQLADSPTPTPANRSGSTTPFPIGKTSMFPNTAPPSTNPTITTAYNGGTSAPCIDNDPRNCPTWVANGFCTSSSYTDAEKRQYCMASCNLCDGGGCRDASANCATWVANGFCSSPSYTDAEKRQYCMASCNLCGDGGCRDAGINCATWVANGFCQSAFYTNDEKKEYCAKSCNMCGGTPETPASCFDASASCVEWVANGFCQNAAYSNEIKKKYCARSCGLCDGTSVTGTSCTDASASCANWVANGFCNNPSYTIDDKKHYCGKSCGLC